MPRGRVRRTDEKDFSKRKHEIVLTDELAVPPVLEKVRAAFGLGYDYDDVKVRKDTSGEYESFLFNKS